ncbi:hypothetical protein Vadar_001252 [Vaccinium darrowii]|uniref:Uncharacterized protein n=1 Tax=Vaccinium darrowii TaxID=229202 RepID=A0ACB7Z8W9_9ERIC|nr:hypothetical protein Vadar_001252 [Vaccinium darrowii]
MYAYCGSVKEAIWEFDEIDDNGNISWNSVMAASTRNQKLEQAVEFWHQMPIPDKISYNELINGFAQFGNIDGAIEIQSHMPNSNSSSWNAIIT